MAIHATCRCPTRATECSRMPNPDPARETPPAQVVYVLAHTHWDREWYLPAGRFRQRLVALIDELLDGDESRSPFLLDGQAVVLDDYLDVRPERAGDLAAALQDGAIEAGPWYVLADELIPSGEALVRNLLAGRRTLRRLGAEPPPVLYSPDAFGHAAALPLIARGFGFDVAIVWRGFGSTRWPDGDTVRWQSADGSAVTLFHLPPDGYELGSNLPVDPANASARWRAMHDVLAARSRTGLLLRSERRRSSRAPGSRDRSDRCARGRRRPDAHGAHDAAPVRERSHHAQRAAHVANRSRRAARLVRLHVDTAGNVRRARAAEAPQRHSRAGADSRRRAVGGARHARRVPDATSSHGCRVAHDAALASARHVVRMLDRRGRARDGRTSR